MLVTIDSNHDTMAKLISQQLYVPAKLWCTQLNKCETLDTLLAASTNVDNSTSTTKTLPSSTSSPSSSTSTRKTNTIDNQPSRSSQQSNNINSSSSSSLTQTNSIVSPLQPKNNNQKQPQPQPQQQQQQQLQFKNQQLQSNNNRNNSNNNRNTATNTNGQNKTQAITPLPNIDKRNAKETPQYNEIHVFYNTPISLSDDISSYHFENHPTAMHFVYLDLTIDGGPAYQRIMQNVSTLQNPILIVRPNSNASISPDLVRSQKKYIINAGNCASNSIADLLSGIIWMHMLVGRHVHQYEILTLLCDEQNIPRPSNDAKRFKHFDSNEPIEYDIYTVLDAKNPKPTKLNDCLDCGNNNNNQ